MSWSENLMSLASNLTIYSSTSLNDALQMRPSVARDFFGSKPFDDWKKGKESEMKMQAAIVGRLNEVIRGIATLAKNSQRGRR